MWVKIRQPEKLIYPETDGQPIGENTAQVRWIVTLLNGLQGLFRGRPDVFVAADLFWYPVHGDPTTVTAPDVLVAFGRPKGDRPSYKQWEEGNVPPQVVFEILSPGNKADELRAKKRFYRRYGVEEYYLYDPDGHALSAHRRDGAKLVAVKPADGFVSPRLGVRFDAPGERDMRLIGPDGHPLKTYEDLVAESETAQQQLADERRRATAEKRRATAEKLRADALADKLRALGIDPDAV